jgi:hypothetical protein
MLYRVRHGALTFYIGMVYPDMFLFEGFQIFTRSSPDACMNHRHLIYILIL